MAERDGAPTPSELLGALRGAVSDADRSGGGLLLSGGVDSSVLAALRPDLAAVTVALEGWGSKAKADATNGCSWCRGRDEYPGGCGADPEYARVTADATGTPWTLVELGVEEALDVLGDVVEATRSYDTGLLNDVPLFAGLRALAARSAEPVVTGEDADMILGGYAFQRAIADWRAAFASIARIPAASARLAERLGVRTRYPYADDSVVELAGHYDWRDLEAGVDGGSPGAFVDQFDPAIAAARSKPWGKVPLRRAAGTLLPAEVAWRPKTDVQFGSAVCRLESHLAEIGRAAVPDRSSRSVDEDASGGAWPVLRDDAHRGMYVLFRRRGLRVARAADGEPACEWCGAAVAGGSVHCATCGRYPARGPVARL